MIRCAAVLLASLALSTTAFPPVTQAQEPAGRSRAAFSDEVSVGWVMVPFSARGRRGFVLDLEPRDVRLLADGQPVSPLSFDLGADAPLELVLLQDLSGSMALGGKLEASRLAAGCFLDRLRPGDRYALASFAGRRLSVEVPFTTDVTAGREAVAAWRPYGVTALHDAVARLPGIRASGSAAGAAVLITDGAENASRIEPEAAREIIRRAQLPVYVLSLARRHGGAGPGESEDYAAILRRLAAASGGRYLPIEHVQELAAACRTVVHELRSRYILGFATGDGESRWRRLEVEVGRRRLEIRARAGYHGPPPASGGSVR